MNSKIMELAITLAELNDSELHVAHAWQSMDEASQWGWQTGVPASELDEWSRGVCDNHQRSFEDLLARFDLGRLVSQIHMVG